jgi:hypothetical protein
MVRPPTSPIPPLPAPPLTPVRCGCSHSLAVPPQFEVQSSKKASTTHHTMANIAGTSIKLLPKSWRSLSVNAPQFRSSLHRSFSQHPAQHTATHSFALPSLDHWEAPAKTDESLHGYGQTHTVFNQSTPLEGYNVFLSDSVLMDSVCREGAMWAFRYLEEVSCFPAPQSAHRMVADG